MEFNRFQQDLKFVNQIGQTLNIDERMRLELALLKLTENYKYDSLYLWGRIEGIDKDYYIALGVQCKGQYEFPMKKFFWCNNANYMFSELPSFNPEFTQRAELYRRPFSGQHEQVIFKAAGTQRIIHILCLESSEANLDDSLEIPSHLPARPFSELERLSYLVHTIEFQCALVPIGAYKILPTHELLQNEHFKGLEVKDVKDPARYQLFRPPQSQEKKDFIARDDALYKPDFLDPLTEAYPKQQWSIQTDSTGINVTIRNLIWPGFVAYHRANSNIFGYAYFGDGIRNSDFEFLL